jgi:hypothetical protein
MNILIKLMSIVSMVIAPTLAQIHKNKTMQTNFKQPTKSEIQASLSKPQKADLVLTDAMMLRNDGEGEVLKD